MFELHFKLWPFSVETAEQRRSFVFQTFLELLVFMAMAAVQWVVLLLLPRSETVKAVERMAPSCIVLFGICLLLFMIFALSAELRGMHCVNWLLTFCIVEGNILALAVLIILTDLLHMGLGFLMAALFVVITVFIAFCMTYDITRNASFVFLLAFCIFLMSVYGAVLYVMLQVIWPFCIYAGVVVLMVLPVSANTLAVRLAALPFSLQRITFVLFATYCYLQLLLYHVKCVLGNGLVKTSLLDDKLAALLLFHDFLALFMLTVYWRPKQ